tara:strand:- start:6 stop:527 length:522 start_codon:yes stop_codon:yes gene_type:complete
MAVREEEEINPIVIDGQEQIAEQEDSLMDEFTPVGDFSKKALNALVKVTRQLQPLFGLKADYPQFTDGTEQLPTEFTRVLMMFKTAVDDAIAQDILDDSQGFVLDDVIDDTGLQVIGGKLNIVLKNKGFKKFLNTPDVTPLNVQEEAPVVDEARTPAPAEMDASLDELFGGRI